MFLSEPLTIWDLLAGTDKERPGCSKTSELYKDWNDTCKPNFEAFVEADMQVIPSPP